MKKIKTISDLNTHEFLLFYRHWKWADAVREEYSKRPMCRGISLFFEPKNGFLFLWYGLLNALLEFREKTNISIPSIRKEIKRVRKPLQLFRNSIVHILPEKGEPTFMPETFPKLLMDPESEGIILKIHSEIGKCLQEELDRRLREVPPKVKMMFNINDSMPQDYLIHQLYSLQGYWI